MMIHANIPGKFFGFGASLLALATTCLAGCAIGQQEGAAGEQEEIGAAADAVSSTGLGYYSCPNGGLSCDLAMGSSVNRTCFLGGVWGSLAEAPDNVPAEVYLTDTSSAYTLHIRQMVSSTTVGAAVVCVGHNPINRHEDAGLGGATKIGGTTTSARRCFLTGVHNYWGMNSFNSLVGVWKGGDGFWYGGGTAGVSIDSVCFDIQTDAGLFAFSNGTNQALSGNTAGNPNGGVACGLQQVGGNFIQTVNDGVSIGYDGRAKTWNWTISSGKTAYDQCFQ